MQTKMGYQAFCCSGNYSVNTVNVLPCGGVFLTACCNVNKIGLTWNLDFPTVGNNGGENIGPSSCLIGAHEDNINAIHNVPQPQRSGYIFKGWRIVTDENDGGE